MLAQREVAQPPGVRCCVTLMRCDDICPVPFPQLRYTKAQPQRQDLASQPSIAPMVQLGKNPILELMKAQSRLHH